MIRPFFAAAHSTCSRSEVGGCLPRRSPARFSHHERGYAVGLVRGEGTIEVREPKLNRIGEMLPSDEIDMSSDAALLEAAYAQCTLDESAYQAPAPAGEQPETAVPPGTRHPAEDEPGVATGGEIGGSAAWRVRRFGRPGRAEGNCWQGWILRPQSCASWLRDNASDVHVELTIDAVARDEGFDRVKLRNGVVEPLEAGGIHVDVNWHNPARWHRRQRWPRQGGWHRPGDYVKSACSLCRFRATGLVTGPRNTGPELAVPLTGASHAALTRPHMAGTGSVSRAARQVGSPVSQPCAASCTP